MMGLLTAFITRVNKFIFGLRAFIICYTRDMGATNSTLVMLLLGADTADFTVWFMDAEDSGLGTGAGVAAAMLRTWGPKSCFHCHRSSLLQLCPR
jgi:hypothetical protein